MKNLARTILFFTLSFALTLGSAAVFFYIFIWFDAAISIPPASFAPLEALHYALRRAVPIALYGSLAISLSYAARRRMPKSLAAGALALLAFLFSGALFWTLSNNAFPGSLIPIQSPESLGHPGIILFQGDTPTIPLEERDNPLGATIIADPNLPLTYRVRNAPLEAFFGGMMGFNVIANSLDEFAILVKTLEKRQTEGLLYFAIYLGSLCLILISLGFIFELTSWPLVNLMAGILAFRGVLALQSFLDSPETQGILTRRIGSIIPPQLLTATALVGLGIILLLLTLTRFLIKNRGQQHG